VSTPVKRRPLHSDDALLDAARTVFARLGFTAASMDAIAAGAGATKPTLYDRFGSKSALYERAVRRDADALVEHLFAAYLTVAEQPVGAMVEASMAAYFGFFEQRPDAYGLLFSSGRAESAELMAEQVLDAVTDRLAEMVAAVLARQGRANTPPARRDAARHRPPRRRSSPARHRAGHGSRAATGHRPRPRRPATHGPRRTALTQGTGEYSRPTFPNGRLEMTDGGSHCCVLQEPALASQIIREFLREA
jgi:AcrR family transcriptional regulator